MGEGHRESEMHHPCTASRRRCRASAFCQAAARAGFGGAPGGPAGARARAADVAALKELIDAYESDEAARIGESGEIV